MSFQWLGKSEDGETITLKRLKASHFKLPSFFTPEWEAENLDQIRVGAALDIETSGLKLGEAKIIEIGIRIFRFNRNTGEILSLDESYSEFQDPGEPLSAEVTEITGITDEMVKGKSIDWNEVDRVLNPAHLIIAHNASFDRPFVDQHSKETQNKVWGCSLKQISWQEKGYPSQKLELLSAFHGFFTDAHRALNDADALLHLLGFSDSSTGSAYFKELIQQAKKTHIRVQAIGAPFESKDSLKDRGYRWEVQNRYWFKDIAPESVLEETAWLEESVYRGSFRGKLLEMPPSDNFKMKAQSP